MKKAKILKILVLGELLVLVGVITVLLGRREKKWQQAMTEAAEQEEEKDFIKWVDFNVTSSALAKAYEYDRDTYGQEVHLDWVELLAYTAAKTGGDFSSEKQVNTCLDTLAEELLAGKKIEALTQELKYYAYYREAYTAVLGGMVGEYELEAAAGDTAVWEKQYGLKAFHPIAKNFPYSDYDDFGVSRSYGYKRQHLGHDFMGQTGTPI